jgi:hypothetical protein
MNKLFEEDDNLPGPVDEAKAIEYVREKFKIDPSVTIDPSLAKSKYEADEYIKMIVRQKDELASDYLKLKADYDARAKLEELLNQRQLPEEREHNPNANKPGIDPSELKQMLQSELSSYKKQERAEDNVKRAKELAREALGSNWQSTLKNRMDELELSEDATIAMMAQSPKVFAQAFGLQTKPQQQSFQAPVSSSQRSDNFKPKVQGQERTWSYYQELKKTNPQAWLDPKIQTQMYQDAQKLGDAFADGDFGPLEVPRKGY